MPAAAQIAITVQLEPPVLPVYDQPPLPEPGYIWTPGYWAYDRDPGYYWVPGTWVQPPEANFLWTPPYWGWADGAYVFHDGYWGTHVGFYGGIDYGFGYGGSGYEGGRWENGNFAYNRTVNNFGETHITNVYESKVTIVSNTRVSFNGGANGVKAQPTPAEITVEHEHHIQPTPVQRQHITAAAKNPELSAKQNGGHPTIAATAHPAQFQGPGVVAAHPVAGGPAERVTPTHEPVVRPDQRATPPNREPAARPEERATPTHEPAARPEERAT
ncbi:MAG: YXWGXW repeat-containing protein, partial [Aliidongia sp.]